MSIKKEILETALKQFLLHGIREMSVQKLVSQLSISTKTFYKYFNNKEELLEEVLRLHYDQQYVNLENLIKLKQPHVVFYEIWHQATLKEYNVNNSFFHDLNYYYPELQKKIQLEIGHKFWKQIKQLISDGIEKGMFRKEINPDVLLETITLLLDKIGRSDQFLKFKIPADEIFNNSIAVIIKGICTQQGLMAIEKHLSEKSNLLDV